ncbi:hypothetical protein NDU88_001704 [Pleurodeles waltl]|uniref:Uncharacterized protein n=1 Tax=Pleurodeles waltl TaxID=8319 RepID=A0AAV7QAW7_PLEWA|nr:hypothetical protein NDU88_001704 [Pleurodeles waltl]
MACEVTALAGRTVAVGGRRPLCEDALVNIEAYGFQEPMTMCAGGRGTHRRASSGGGDLASEQEGAAGHQAPVGTDTDTEGTSDPEGEGSTTTGAGGDTSDTDTSSFGSSLAGAAPSVPPATTGTAATQRTSTALPAAPQSSLRGRSARKARVSFAPGTSAPASVTPAALSAELIDLVRTLIVGQTTLLNAI